MLVHAGYSVSASQPVFSRKSEMVRRVGLTDLCLFTEATYTRNLSMTDAATPFQDAPASFEHFPTGAVVTPPPHLTVSHVTKH